MARRQCVVIHERLGTWARQVRSRVAAWPVQVVESRSGPDLAAACARASCPILVIDLGDRPQTGLEDLDRAARAAPNALSLVLDPRARAGVAELARELGATLVLSGPVPPPKVLDLLAAWVPLAIRRAEADGWAVEPRPEVEPWAALLAEELGTGAPAGRA